MTVTRYRLPDMTAYGKGLSETLYAAFEALKNPQAPYKPGERARLIESLITYSAGAHTPKAPDSVLATLLWVVEMAQERATDSDFNTAREALDEHAALGFVTDWLEAHGLDVARIRGAELSAEARASLVEEADAEQAKLDALEAAQTGETPADVITEALAPFLGSTVAENHSDDVLAALDAAGFTITRKDA
ncbi:hypothetical protein D869_gp086 [Caulobacter phage CcrRogue]|uniref:Uncharacterized protein n=1 Tax=Caulobacter phage CcrRogue TaxID=2927986 RepID=K4K2T9_9CAUD|nr:hypothetical protein D869_gp015 [Caulobacter phage CcrRogue]YP_006989375.1 hypothetical protein D869_gp086 [Caulobacter phage CcrRogue]AFU86497.1 hypothetical protein CcrRogue_gp015 [Caulobacter phage CcrRogue]AFU86828.1 hypothetical protein CcrRogue_gp346 [Caulobacter phage CcrRogue]